MKVKDLNLETLQKTVNDDYDKKIVIGYEDKIVEIHEDGEKWIDSNGIHWKRENGKNINITMKEQIEEQKKIFSCQRCGKYMLLSTHIKDMKIFMKTGMCQDCLVKEDTKRVIDGTFKEYEDKKIKENKISWLKDVRKEIDVIIENYNNQQIFNEVNGTSIEIENWKTDIGPEQLKKLLMKVYDDTVISLGLTIGEII